MKQLILLSVLLSGMPCMAQLTREQRIQDSIIGWDSKNIYDKAIKPATSATARQKEAYLNKFAEWVKKSYTPVAGMGEYQRFINASNYFVLFHVWDVGFNQLDAQKHFRPIGETGYPRFWVGANILTGTWNIDFMNKDDWFFTMQPNGAPAQTVIESNKKMKGRDAHIDPNVYPYITWINEMNAVYLAPGNQLPMRQLTKGEFLNRALERMDYVQDSLIKEDIEKDYRKDEASKADIRNYRKKEMDDIRTVIRQLLDKYRNRLNEPAFINSFQVRYNFFSPGSDDIFTGNDNAILYPVYTIDAATIRKMSGSTPLWVAVLFTYADITDGNKKYEAYKAITENLNYEYIYNYFFDPQKVKGVEYQPANELSLKARLDDYRRRNKYDNTVAGSNSKSTPGVLFHEDFSSDSAGSDPAAWYYYKAGTIPHVVTKIKGMPGKWLKPGYGRSIKPKFLKTLPANFTFECDVATDGNYSTNTGGALQIELTNCDLAANNDVKGSPKGVQTADIKITVTAGNEVDYNNNNYRGMLGVRVINAPETNVENNSKGIKAEYPLTQFTDKKTKVHITLQVKDGAITVMVNNKIVIQPADFKMTYGGNCRLCGVPPGLRLKNLLVRNITNDADKTGVYIGNIEIR